MFRYRHTNKHYFSQPKSDECPFCHLDKARVEAQTEHAAVIRNIYPYDLWEYRNVVDHLMIVPRRHVDRLDKLTKGELSDIMAFITEYEGKAYNIYSRSHGSVQKSVPGHQHTHLIATDNRPARLVFFIKRPYWLFKK